jgi:hypothetical protein
VKRPGLFEGVGVAAIASISGGMLRVLLSPFSGDWLVHAIVAGCGLGYVLYLLRRTRERVGRPTTLLCWGGAAVLVACFSPSLAVTALAHTGLIWLVRALYHHSSPLTALADLGLAALGYAAALWAALETHSLFASLWCFFLVQALFPALPASIAGGRPQAQRAAEDDRFPRALRSAELAVRKLTTRP